MATLSDHQDSDLFSYERTWDEIETMLAKAETKRNQWLIIYERAKANGNRKQMLISARNSKALEGVIKTLRWTLGDKNIEHPLE